jgi:hypothetical protein
MVGIERLQLAGLAAGTALGGSSREVLKLKGASGCGSDTVKAGTP